MFSDPGIFRFIGFAPVAIRIYLLLRIVVFFLLMFTHSGQGLGKPRRPDNPYEPASINNRQRSGLWIAFVLTAVAMLYEANVLFSGE